MGSTRLRVRIRCLTGLGLLVDPNARGTARHICACHTHNLSIPPQFDFKEVVDDPFKNLKLRRFRTSIIAPGTFWKSKADTILHAAGVKCGIDISEINNDVPTLLAKPHLFECDPKDLLASSEYTVPVWNTSKFDVGDVDTSLDYEPHTGMVVCAHERLAAYFILDPSLTKVFYGGMCGTVPDAKYPTTLVTCAKPKKIIVPYYWAHRSPCLTEKQSTSLKENFDMVGAKRETWFELSHRTVA